MTEKVLRQFQIAGSVVNQTGRRMAKCGKARRSLRHRDIQPIENRVQHIFQNQLQVISRPCRLFKSLALWLVAFSDWRSLNQVIVQRDIENSLEDDQDIPISLLVQNPIQGSQKPRGSICL